MPLLTRCSLTLSLVLFSLPLAAHEPPSGLLLHLPFDGTLSDRSGHGFGGEAVQGDGEPAPGGPKFDEGRFGQALVLDGSYAVRVPLDLSFEIYPVVTITAWIYAENDRAGGYVFSNGGRQGHAVSVSGTWFGMLTPGGQLGEKGAMRKGRWVFTAAIYDYKTGEGTLVYGQRKLTIGFGDGKAEKPEIDTWIGTFNGRFQAASKNFRVDDVRVYDRALSRDELEGLWLGPDATDQHSSEEPQLIEPPLPPEKDEPELIEPPLPSNEEADADPFGGAGQTESAGEDLQKSLDEGRREASNEALNDRESLDNLRQTNTDPLGDAGDVASDGERLQGSLEQGRQRQAADSVPSGEFETREQALEPGTDPVRGSGDASAGGSLEVTPGDDDEVFLNLEPGDGTKVTPQGWGQPTMPASDYFTLDLGQNALHTIQWFEENDHPCKIVVYGYAPGLNQFGAPRTVSFGRDLCRNSANERSKKSVSVQDSHGTVEKIQVCLSGTGNLQRPATIKGIYIWGYEISGSGSLAENEYGGDREERANCGRWRPALDCPAGTVATGVEVQYLRTTTTIPLGYLGAIRDLALICRELAD